MRCLRFGAEGYRRLVDSFFFLGLTRRAHTDQNLHHTDPSVFVTKLRVCAKNKDLHKGTSLHHEILKRGLLHSCSDALITMYAQCGAITRAEELLNTHESRDVVSWTTIVAAYARQEQALEALDCFERMQHEGLAPHAVTFTCVLKACGSLKAVEKGNRIHDEITRQGLLEGNIVLGNALVDMYAKCRALGKAQRVLEELPTRDVVSWNALISGYAHEGEGVQALNCFEEMQRERIIPNKVTFLSILKACGSIRAVDKGEQVHDRITKQGLLEKNVLLGTALVDMYAKCGALEKAQRLLEELPARDVVTWSALIAGYSEQGHGEQALLCYARMQGEGLSPNAVTFLSILKACGSIKALDKGGEIHNEIGKRGLLKHNIVLGSSLVDMYAKCGAVVKAQQVLKELPRRDVVCWNALIGGYAEQGNDEHVLKCFDSMQLEGIRPDALTFLYLLKACGSIRAADKGQHIHDKIVRQGLLGEDALLGSALVDMYAKCGSLVMARQVLEELPIRNVAAWSALIGGYAEQGQGEEALNCLQQMRRDALSPNVVTFLSALKACASLGAVDKGEQIHDELARLGFLGRDTMLDNALVDMYAKCGALAKARQVLEELPVRDVVTWNTLIAGYAEMGQGDGVFDCFERIQQEGLHPNAVTFLCVLSACNHAGLVDDAHMYLANMNAIHGAKPDLKHYSCVADLLGRLGHVDEAVRVIQKMPASGHSPDHTWSALLEACTKWGDVSVGRWAFEHALQSER